MSSDDPNDPPGVPLHIKLRRLAVLAEHAPEVVEDVKGLVRRGRALFGLAAASRLSKIKRDIGKANDPE